jgi:hypothetical protein
MTSKGATIDVGAWLRGLGLGEYEATFRENAIDDTVQPDGRGLEGPGPSALWGTAASSSMPSPPCTLAQTQKHRRDRPRRYRQRRLLPLRHRKPLESAAMSR